MCLRKGQLPLSTSSNVVPGVQASPPCANPRPKRTGKRCLFLALWACLALLHLAFRFGIVRSNNAHEARVVPTRRLT